MQALLFDKTLEEYSAAELLTAYMSKHVEVDKITSPGDVYPLLLDHAADLQESFFVVCLDGAHQVIGHKAISLGTLNRTLVHPREVFRYAIKNSSAAIIVAHNHPSGNPEPSNEDKELTTRLVDAGKIIGIQVLDHVIITKDGYHSFLEEGEM